MPSGSPAGGAGGGAAGLGARALARARWRDHSARRAAWSSPRAPPRAAAVSRSSPPPGLARAPERPPTGSDGRHGRNLHRLGGHGLDHRLNLCQSGSCPGPRRCAPPGTEVPEWPGCRRRGHLRSGSGEVALAHVLHLDGSGGHDHCCRHSGRRLRGERRDARRDRAAGGDAAGRGHGDSRHAGATSAPPEAAAPAAPAPPTLTFATHSFLRKMSGPIG